MTLGELKRGLTRFPADMDDSDIVIVHASKGAILSDNLAAIAVPSDNETTKSLDDPIDAVVLLTEAGAREYVSREKAVWWSGNKVTENDLKPADDSNGK